MILFFFTKCVKLFIIFKRGELYSMDNITLDKSFKIEGHLNIRIILKETGEWFYSFYDDGLNAEKALEKGEKLASTHFYKVDKSRVKELEEYLLDYSGNDSIALLNLTCGVDKYIVQSREFVDNTSLVALTFIGKESGKKFASINRIIIDNGDIMTGVRESLPNERHNDNDHDITHIRKRSTIGEEVSKFETVSNESYKNGLFGKPKLVKKTYQIPSGKYGTDLEEEEAIRIVGPQEYNPKFNCAVQIRRNKWCYWIILDGEGYRYDPSFVNVEADQYGFSVEEILNPLPSETYYGRIDNRDPVGLKDVTLVLSRIVQNNCYFPVQCLKGYDPSKMKIDGEKFVLETIVNGMPVEYSGELNEDNQVVEWLTVKWKKPSNAILDSYELMFDHDKLFEELSGLVEDTDYHSFKPFHKSLPANTEFPSMDSLIFDDSNYIFDGDTIFLGFDEFVSLKEKGNKQLIIFNLSIDGKTYKFTGTVNRKEKTKCISELTGYVKLRKVVINIEDEVSLNQIAKKIKDTVLNLTGVKCDSISNEKEIINPTMTPELEKSRKLLLKINAQKYNCDKNGYLVPQFVSNEYFGAVYFSEKDRPVSRDPENYLYNLLRSKIKGWFIVNSEYNNYATSFDLLEKNETGFSFVNSVYPAAFLNRYTYSQSHMNVCVNCEGEIDVKGDTGLKNVTLKSFYDAYMSERRQFSVESLVGYDSSRIKIDNNRVSVEELRGYNPLKLKDGSRHFKLEVERNGRIYLYDGYIDDNNNIVGILKVEIKREIPEETIKDRKKLEFNNEVFSALISEEVRNAKESLYYVKSEGIESLEAGTTVAVQKDNSLAIFDNNMSLKMYIGKNLRSKSKRWEFIIYNGENEDRLYGITDQDDDFIKHIIGRINNAPVFIDVTHEQTISGIVAKISQITERCKKIEPSKKNGSMKLKRLSENNKFKTGYRLKSNEE